MFLDTLNMCFGHLLVEKSLTDRRTDLVRICPFQALISLNTAKCLGVIMKSLLSYRESHQNKLGIGQNDVPEFNGDNFETFGTLPEKINAFSDRRIRNKSTF